MDRHSVIRQGVRWSVVALSAVVLTVVALELAEREASEDAGAAGTEATPAVVSSIKGSDLMRVKLAKQAAERIGLELVKVGKARGRQTVPYSAVIYDESGKTWVYTSTSALTFVRAPITIRSIEGNRAILVSGPAAGTDVVEVGAAELYGAELGVDH